MTKPPKPRRRKSLTLVRHAPPRSAYCPKCGHPLLCDDSELPPIKQRILEIVQRHGRVPAEVIHAAIWGSDPNGGPDMKTLHVHIHQLNRRLALHGMAVRAGRGRMFYRLVAEAAE